MICDGRSPRNNSNSSRGQPFRGGSNSKLVASGSQAKDSKAHTAKTRVECTIRQQAGCYDVVVVDASPIIECLSYDDNRTVLKIPYNLYGLTKRWGEEACQLYCPQGLKVLRLSMPFGPGLLPGKGRALRPQRAAAFED